MASVSIFVDPPSLRLRQTPPGPKCGDSGSAVPACDQYQYV
jgi:hypothetical protein